MILEYLERLYFFFEIAGKTICSKRVDLSAHHFDRRRGSGEGRHDREAGRRRRVPHPRGAKGDIEGV
jgi:hypothetical protein